jgi:hypothetical protein
MTVTAIEDDDGTRLTPEEEPSADYVARFTHGTLEWIRPWADFPEPQHHVASVR